MRSPMQFVSFLYISHAQVSSECSMTWLQPAAQDVFLKSNYLSHRYRYRIGQESRGWSVSQLSDMVKMPEIITFYRWLHFDTLQRLYSMDLAILDLSEATHEGRIQEWANQGLQRMHSYFRTSKEKTRKWTPISQSPSRLCQWPEDLPPFKGSNLLRAPLRDQSSHTWALGGRFQLQRIASRDPKNRHTERQRDLCGVRSVRDGKSPL